MKMNNATTPPIQKAEAWHKFSWVWSIALFGLWGYWTYFALNNPTNEIPYRDLLIISATALALAIYTWFWVHNIRNPIGGRSNPTVSLLVCLSLVLIWFLQIFIAPTVVWTMSALIAIIYVHNPIKRAIALIILLFTLGGIAVANYLGTAPFSLIGTFASVGFFLSFGLLTIILALWIDRIIVQSFERQNLIEELRSTQAELAKVEHEKGILTERQRLAHEIHDTLAQGFTSIIMEMEAAEGSIQLAGKDPLPHIQRARGTAQRNLNQVRHVLQDLRGEELANRTLEQILSQEVESWSNQTGIATEFKLTGAPDEIETNEEINHLFLRLTQEALTNIRKHAQANDVSVTLSYLSSCIILDVQDNGVGLDESSDRAGSPLSGGMGIPTMTERIKGMGGSLTIESNSGCGTTVVAQVPV